MKFFIFLFCLLNCFLLAKTPEDFSQLRPLTKDEEMFLQNALESDNPLLGVSSEHAAIDIDQENIVPWYLGPIPFVIVMGSGGYIVYRLSNDSERLYNEMASRQRSKSIEDVIDAWRRMPRY
jgi:hypothetical protein